MVDGQITVTSQNSGPQAASRFSSSPSFVANLRGVTGLKEFHFSRQLKTSKNAYLTGFLVGSSEAR